MVIFHGKLLVYWRVGGCHWPKWLAPWPPGALAPTLARRVRRISQSVLCLAFVGGASEGPENHGFVNVHIIWLVV